MQDDFKIDSSIFQGDEIELAKRIHAKVQAEEDAHPFRKLLKDEPSEMQKLADSMTEISPEEQEQREQTATIRQKVKNVLSQIMG